MITKKQLQRLISLRLSLRQIAVEVNQSQATVRYWLRRHELKTARGPRGTWAPPGKKLCGRCGETSKSRFYGAKRSICAKCQNAYNHDQGRKKRLRIVQHLGGACTCCGYHKYMAALDVHHTDPSRKDPAWKTVRYWSWVRIEKELEGCRLVCRNCHAAIHSGELKLGE